MKTGTVAKLALVLVAAGLALGLALGLAKILGSFRPLERNVSESFIVYIEGMSPSGKLVLLESVQRLTASRDFTMKLLSVVALQAKIKVRALADVAYYVDLKDSSRWGAHYNRATGVLVIDAPRPDCLPPAIRTDSIEVDTEGANLLSSALFSLKREAEAMKAELSADFLSQARSVLATEELRKRLASSLEESAAAFCQNALGLKPAKVIVRFSLAGEAKGR